MVWIELWKFMLVLFVFSLGFGLIGFIIRDSINPLNCYNCGKLLFPEKDTMLIKCKKCKSHIANWEAWKDE